MSIMRKFKRRNEVEQRKYYEDVRTAAKKLANIALYGADEKFQQGLKDYGQAALLATVAAAAQVLTENWGTLNKKETRITKFVELCMNEIDNFRGYGAIAIAEKARKTLKEKWDVEITLGDENDGRSN